MGAEIRLIQFTVVYRASFDLDRWSLTLREFSRELRGEPEVLEKHVSRKC